MRSPANGNIGRFPHVRVRTWRNPFVAGAAAVDASNASKHRPNDMTRSATAAFAAHVSEKLNGMWKSP
jgi:hypothetical protein